MPKYGQTVWKQVKLSDCGLVCPDRDFMLEWIRKNLIKNIFRFIIITRSILRWNLLKPGLKNRTSIFIVTKFFFPLSFSFPKTTFYSPWSLSCPGWPLYFPSWSRYRHGWPLYCPSWPLYCPSWLLYRHGWPLHCSGWPFYIPR